MQSDYYNENLRSFSIEYNSGGFESKIDEFIEKNKPEIQRIYAVLNNGGDNIIANYFGETRKKFKVQMGRYFDSNYEKSILIPFNNDDNYFVGGTYKINGEEFTVIGINSDDVYEIQYGALDNFDNITDIIIVASNKMNAAAKQKFADKIKAIFKTENVLFADAVQKAAIRQDLFIIMCIIMLGVLNISSVFLCVMEKRKKQQAVFNILGCPKIRLFSIYIFEFFILITVSFILYSLFTKYIIFTILSFYDKFFFHALTISQYLFLYAIYTIPLILVLIYQLIRFFGKTPFELNRR
jgi:hypothetical protein